MSPLADDIYDILRPRVPSVDGRIGYSEMIVELPAVHGVEFPNDYRLNPAYSKIVTACRTLGLPPITAILVHFEGGRLSEPGDGYYEAAHSGVTDREQRSILWARDWEEAQRTTYPERI